MDLILPSYEIWLFIDLLYDIYMQFFLFLCVFTASMDAGFAIYGRYAQEDNYTSISYVAHITGAAAGLTIGLLVLKNFEQRLREQVIWWIALGIYLACMLFAILFNIFN